MISNTGLNLSIAGAYGPGDAIAVSEGCGGGLCESKRYGLVLENPLWKHAGSTEMKV